METRIAVALSSEAVALETSLASVDVTASGEGHAEKEFL
jgi:hypothetical protein